MEGDFFDETDEGLIEKLCTEEYKPNPLETYEAFKNKRKASLKKEVNESSDSIFNGVLLFAKMGVEHERIRWLLDQFITIQDHPVFKEGDVESLRKQIVEENMFGLKDEDYEQLLAYAEQVKEKGEKINARDMYRTMTMIFPTGVEGWVRWAEAETELTLDPKIVLPIYDNCLILFPDEPIVHFHLGMYYLKENDLKRAEDCFKKVIELAHEQGNEELIKKLETILADVKSIK